MGIIFKKNGRPTKTEKATLKNINNFLSSLSDEEKSGYIFSNEKVTSGERLNNIWNGIITPEQAAVKIETKTQSEVLRDKLHEMNSRGQAKEEVVDTETGEIFDKNEKVDQEDSNFVNNNEQMEQEEAEILSQTNDNTESVDEPISSFNPLSDPIHQRSYQKKELLDVGEIEEPDFGDTQSAQEKLADIEEQKIYKEEEHKFHQEEELEAEEEKAAPKEWQNIRNEGMEELDKKDAELASEQLVDTVLDGYEMLHELGKKFVKYPDEKVQEKVMNGEIDASMEIPISETETTNVIDFFKEFNEQAEEAIAFDPEFADKVRPAMIRVFSKKGWGMTDEQFLLVAFGKDIAWKGVQVMNLKKTANGIMGTFVKLQKEKNEAIRQARRQQVRQAPPLQPDSITTPPRQEKQTYREDYQSETQANEDSEARDSYTEDSVQGIGEEQSSSTEIVQIHG